MGMWKNAMNFLGWSPTTLKIKTAALKGSRYSIELSVLEFI